VTDLLRTSPPTPGTVASDAGARGKFARLTHWGALVTWPTAPGRVCIPAHLTGYPPSR